MTPKRLFVVDAMAMAFRNFHAFSARPLSTAAGLPTSAVYGSSIFLLKLIQDEHPDYLVIATDTKAPTFRHDMYPAYKANRKEMPEDLAAQIPYLYKLFDALGCKTLIQPGVEADDLIGSLVKQNAGDELDCYIVSGDKDFLQLVNHHIFLYAPKKNEPAQILGIPGVKEKFSCTPEQVIDILALIGDTADNIPGVFGIGEKGAAKLISTYGSLEGIYAHIDDIANAKQRENLINSRDMAFLSRTLLTIKTDLTLPWTLSDLVLDAKAATANTKLLGLFNELEFRSLSARVSADLKEGPSAPVVAELKENPPKKITLPPLELIPAADSIRVAEADHVVRPGYLLINTPGLLTDFQKSIAEATSLSFDTETTGLNPITDRPIGLSLAAAKGQAWYLPFVEKHLERGLLPKQVIAAVKPLLEDPKRTKIAHNAKFDIQMLLNAGIDVRGPLVDTMICSWLLDSTSRDHSLDTCSLHALNMNKIPTTQLMGPKKDRPMIDVPLPLLADYACEDADATLQLSSFFMPKIASAGLSAVFSEIEMPLVPILARMEREGVYVDAATLDEISTKLAERIKELERDIHAEAGEEFNINSTQQLAVILFEKLKVHELLGVKRLKKTKTGFSTDVSVLEALSEHPLPKKLLEYRTLTKLKNTYVDSLPQLINPKTNRIHSSFHQTGTATGRLSSSDPNLQNIPIRTDQGREIRKAFRASSRGLVLLSADYSQVELRLLAHIAKESALIEAFVRGEDIHRATAARIFGLAPEEVDSATRSKAKAINFGIIYGMGPQRLARQTGVSMSEAKDFIQKYFEGYPGIKKYIEESIATARKTGFATTITGRRRPIPEFASTDRMMLVNAENIAVNSPIQGSAADLIKIAMIRIEKSFEEKRLPAKMLLQVHDELVFECRADQAEMVKTEVKSCMESAMQLDVPLLAEAGFGDNWLEAH